MSEQLLTCPEPFIYRDFKGGYVKRLNVLQGFPPRRAIQNADVRNTANTEAYIANTDAYLLYTECYYSYLARGYSYLTHVLTSFSATDIEIEKALKSFGLKGFSLKSGGLLLSRIALQYHRRKRA